MKRLATEVRFYYLNFECHEISTYATSREKAIRIADRWIRLFWRRYVQAVRARHPGSIAAAYTRGDARCIVRESGPLDSAGIIPHSPWPVVYDVALPVVVDTKE